MKEKIKIVKQKWVLSGCMDGEKMVDMRRKSKENPSSKVSQTFVPKPKDNKTIEDWREGVVILAQQRRNIS